ncbi:MAG TPA: hypothetical protein ENH84_04195 [Phycisphaerae bacterium]|nr:hypothetical protein [Phycisphaerae bacterium]
MPTKKLWGIVISLVGANLIGCGSALTSVDKPYFAEVRDDFLRIYVTRDIIYPAWEMVDTPVYHSVMLYEKGQFREYCEVLSVKRLDDEEFDIIGNLLGNYHNRKVWRIGKKKYSGCTSYGWWGAQGERRERHWRSFGLYHCEDGRVRLSVKDSWGHLFRIMIPDMDPSKKLPSSP